MEVIVVQIFFPLKYLKIFLSILILLIGISGNVAFSADFLRHDHDILGKIVDFDTRKPIAGVVVSAMWFTWPVSLSIEPKMKYYDYFETLTNKEGNFRIPGKGLNIIRDMPPPKIAIFKAGYSILHLQDLGANFKQDHPLSGKVKWIEGKPIIPYKRKSLEKRKSYLRTHPRVPFKKMEYVIVSQEKTRQFIEELRREYKAVGMTPTQLNDQQYLRYKNGGVFPSEETSVKRKSSE
jgi:hypothetical protein